MHTGVERCGMRKTGSLVLALVSILALTLLAGCGGSGKSAEEHRRSAAEYVRQEKLAEAVLELRNATARDPKNVDGHRALAEVYAKTGDVRGALKEYHAIVSLKADDVEARLQLAKLYLAGGRWEDARVHAARAAELAPNRFEAHEALAYAHAGLKKYENAVAEAKRAAALAPDNEQVLAAVARVHGAARDQKAAEEALRSGLARLPKSKVLTVELAAFLASRSRLAEADELMEQFLRNGPNDFQVLGLVAQYRLKRGDMSQAEKLLRARTELKGGNGEQHRLALKELASFYTYVVGKLPEAGQTLEELRKLAPEDAGTLRSVAELHLLSGAPEKAEAVLQELTKNAPRDPDTRLLRARIDLDRGRSAEAKAELEKLVREAPASPNVQFFLGKAYFASKEWEKASDAYRAALAKNSGHIFAMLELARVNLILGHPQDALEQAETVLRIMPRSSDARLVRADALMACGKTGEAEAVYKAQLATGGAHAGLELRLAEALAAQGKSSEALNHLKAAQRLAPKAVEPVLREMGLLARLGRGQEAERVATQYLSTKGEVASVLNALVVLASRRRDYAAAQGFIRRSLAADPKDPGTRELEARLALAQGDRASARRLLDEALKLSPTRVSSLLLVADLLGSEGKRAEAQTTYERVLQVEGKNFVAANNLAMIYREDQAKLSEALRLAQVAVDVSERKPIALDTLGWVQVKMGNFEAAARNLEEARKAVPKDPELAFHLGVAYQKLGNEAKAKKLLNEALNAPKKGDWAVEATQALQELSAGSTAGRSGAAQDPAGLKLP